MTTVKPTKPSWSNVGRSLKNKNIRRYLAGQGLSNTGLWMQQVAELWLIFELTGSGSALGLHSVLRYGPMLLFGAQAGLLTDRMERLKLLKVTQLINAVAAGALAISSWFFIPSLALIYIIVFVQGCVNSVDNPLRKGFVRDMANDDELASAVSINSTMGSVTRMLGPAVGGLIVATMGVKWCFVVNATSYGAVLAALYTIDRSKLRPPSLAPSGRGQIRAGLAYAWKIKEIATILAVVAVVGTLAWNYNVLMPIYSTETLGGNATLYGVLLSVVGAGAFVGAIMTARAFRIENRRLIASTAVLALALGLAAAAPSLPSAVVALFLLGAAATAVTVGAQARLQLRVADQFSGRVMALFAVCFVGSKPLGGILAGWFLDISGPRLAFAVGSGAIGAVSLWLILYRGWATDV